MSWLKNYIYPISTLVGTIIGVGFFSLPYVTLKVGFWAMLVYFLVIGVLLIFIHLIFGELAIKTPDYKRLPGFARIYLGKWGEKIAIISTILGIFGAILAYLIIGGAFLSDLLSPIFSGNIIFYTLIYFLAGALIIFFDIKIVSKIEFWGLISFFLILIAVFFKSHSLINVGNIFTSLNANYLFLPYGIILFSLWGLDLIPETEEMLGEKKNLLKIIIPISILIPILVYIFFIYLILGISGSQTTESALAGLKNYLGGAVNLLLLAGFLTTFTSFISIGLTLKKIFWYDLKIGKNLAWVIACFTPLILFLIGIKNFIPVISMVGGVMLGIDGILILLMYQKIKPERKILVSPLIIIFLLGIIYEIIYFSK